MGQVLANHDYALLVLRLGLRLMPRNVLHELVLHSSGVDARVTTKGRTARELSPE